MVIVFPMICHLFQVTLIKKPHLGWHLRKLKLLLIECIKSIYILENEHLPHKAQRIITTTELSSCVISLEVLYLLLKVYNLSTRLPRNTTQNNLQYLKWKKPSVFAWIFGWIGYLDSDSLFSLQILSFFPNLCKTIPYWSNVGENFWTEILKYKLKSSKGKARWGSTCSFILKVSKLQLEYMYLKWDHDTAIKCIKSFYPS